MKKIHFLKILTFTFIAFFVISCSQEPEVIHGKDGKDGINGVDGKDGINGKNGKNGADGKDGKDGINGKDGKNGADGKNGKDGVNGKDGKDGIDGKDGKNGENGKDGKNGVNGKDGKDGKDGKNGNGSNTGQGFTKIVLSGAITDAEAQTLISEQIGENTNTILILNTTNLTTVSFSNLPKIVDVKIENNSKLTNVSFGNLKSVYQNFTVKYNDVLTKIDLPILEEVYSIDLYKNNSLTEFFTPKLVGVYNSVRIEYTGIKHIDFSNAKSNLRTALYIRGNHSLETIKLGFKDVDGYGYIFDKSQANIINKNPNLRLFQARNLRVISTLIIEKNNLLQQLVLPSLKTIKGGQNGYGFGVDNDNIKVLNLNSLEVVNTEKGSLYLRMQKLEKITLPKLKEGGVYIQSPVLKEIGLPSLTELSISVKGNLTQASVDKLLANLASAIPVIKNKTISIQGASPSQVGQVNLQKLHTNGNTVTFTVF